MFGDYVAVMLERLEGDEPGSDCALASKPYSTSTDPEISSGTNGTSALTGPSPALSAQPVSLSMSAPLRTYCSPGTRLA